MKTAVLLFTFLIFGIVAHPQMQSPADTVHIREIRVLAKKKPREAGLKMTRPDSLERVSSITSDLSELIADYSPVFIKSYGGGSQATASFRGTAATHTQVLWNGMNLNSPMRGIADLALLPVFFIDEVTLLHGGSSLTEGSGGLGGSIHLENKPDWGSDLQLRGMLESSSFSTRKFFFKGMAGGKRFQSITRVFYAASKNDFSFWNTGVIPSRNDTLENAGYDKTGILQEFYFRRRSNEVFTLRFWAQQSDRNLPQLMSYEGSDREEFQKDAQLRGQLEWKKYSDEMNLHLSSGYYFNELGYYRGTPAFDFVNEDSESRESGFMNHFRLFRNISDQLYGTVSLDVNYFQVQAMDKTGESGYEKDRLESSLLMNVHFKPSGRLGAFLLVRSETYDRRIVPLVPAAGLEWQPLRSLPVLLSVNAARNYHKPSLNDLYWLPGGNPELLSEDGYSGDLSLSTRFEKGETMFTTEITGFLNRVNNWIIWQPAANGAYYWEAANVKDVLSRGLEYSFSSVFQWEKVRFRQGGHYAYTHTSNQTAIRSVDRSRGKQLIYIPRHKGHVYFNVSWHDFSLKYDLSYVGKRYTQSSNRESDYERVLNPYWLNKITLGKNMNWENYTLNLKLTVENVLDENYQSILWRPMPGRFYRFSVALNYRK